MSEGVEDPRCPECGGPIGQTATYCMHCSADLTDEAMAGEDDEVGQWGDTDDGTQSTAAAGAAVSSDVLLDPDGLVDNSLTIVVGIAGGLLVGIVGTSVLLVATGNAWALAFGVLAWLVATAHLVRRRTVQGAVARSAYAVALVLLAVPVIALSPVVDVDGGLAARSGLFVFLLVFVAVPAGFAAIVGWVASQYVPDDGTGDTEAY